MPERAAPKLGQRLRQPQFVAPASALATLVAVAVPALTVRARSNPPPECASTESLTERVDKLERVEADREQRLRMLEGSTKVVESKVTGIEGTLKDVQTDVRALVVATARRGR